MSSNNNKQPGRPPADNPPIIVGVKLRLYPGQDNDLLAFFERIPARMRATMVKMALRSGAESISAADLPDEAELIAALDALMEIEEL